MTVCPKCGKSSRGLCLDCFLEEHPIKAGEVSVYSCNCGRLRHRERWDASAGELSKTVASAVKVPYELKPASVDVKTSISEKTADHAITVKGAYQGSVFERTFPAKTIIQKTTCPACSRKSGGYYEAILQFRCGIPKVSIDESQVAKMERVRGGVDYYILSNNYAKSVASQLKRMGLTVKSSEKIFSMREGREIYRVSYSIKDE
jgi:nonsense-mediated mRNA decay protein 3